MDEPRVTVLQNDMTLRWPCRRGDFLLWLRFRNVFSQPDKIDCEDLWEMRDGYHVTITNRMEDLPPWFELHHTEVVNSLAYKLMAKVEKGYKLGQGRMDGSNLWRLRAGDRVVWVGRGRPEQPSVGGVLAILACEDCGLAVGECNWERPEEAAVYGAPLDGPMKEEDVGRCRTAVEMAKKLGVPRTWGTDWALG